MADITTATVAPISMQTWSVIPGLDETWIPRGEVLFQGSQIIPSKLAADENKWTLQCLFPRNFAYKIAEVRIWALSNGSGPMEDFERQMSALVSSDDEEVDDWFFSMLNEGPLLESPPRNDSFAFDFTSVTLDRMTFLVPAGDLGALIEAGSAAAQLFLQWMDVSTDATTAVTAFFRIRCLMYDISQARYWPIHTPTPIIAS